MSAWGRAVILAFIVLVTATACVSSVEYGVKPKTDRLVRLQVGMSERAQILAALGPPRGKGVARLAGLPEPREIWYYEHVKTDGSQVEMSMLLAYVKDGRYDGHLWFSSAQVLQQKSW